MLRRRNIYRAGHWFSLDIIATHYFLIIQTQDRAAIIYIAMYVTYLPCTSYRLPKMEVNQWHGHVYHVCAMHVIPIVKAWTLTSCVLQIFCTIDCCQHLDVNPCPSSCLEYLSLLCPYDCSFLLMTATSGVNLGAVTGNQA